jgi:hypothetical protein
MAQGKDFFSFSAKMALEPLRLPLAYRSDGGRRMGRLSDGRRISLKAGTEEVGSTVSVPLPLKEARDTLMGIALVPGNRVGGAGGGVATAAVASEVDFMR